MLYGLLVDGVSNQMLKSFSFSQARTSICAASMSVKMQTSLKSFLCNVISLIQRKYETQYNFHHHASAVVLFLPTLSNCPLSHYSHPLQRRT